MNAYLNYLLEANISLLLFLAYYKLFLNRENNFSVQRLILLTGVVVSVVFPMIHLPFGQGTSALSIGHVIPSYWLPEVVIGGEDVQATHETSFNFWKYTTLIYSIGLVSGFVIILFQLTQLFRIIRRSTTYRMNKLRIAESTENKPTFSFFHFIFIGKAHQLSSAEKQQIIQHESVHARQWHSLDILVVNILKIFFWFNPCINIYKKIFIQLHEFEADARAVQNSDVNKYCSLLAKVALQSADYSLANHFNNSLTVKRIEMMRTLKKKIHPWKLAALAGIIPLSFYIIACQDQVLKEVTESTVSQRSEYPEAVKRDMDLYMKEHPDAKLTYLEGLPAEIDKITVAQQAAGMIVNAYDLRATGVDKKGVLFHDLTNHAKELKTEGEIFTVVEEVATFDGGYAKLLEHLKNNIRYPVDARKAGKSGTVYVEFVVNEDGSLSDFKVVKGVDPEIDAEALRAVKTLPPWHPGKQNGVAVRERYVLPISFNSDFPQKQDEMITESPYKMDVKYTKKVLSSGNTVVEGVVYGQNEKALAGANIIIFGTTTGTTTDADGNFRLELPKDKSQLVFSFVGYDFKKIDF